MAELSTSRKVVYGLIPGMLLLLLAFGAAEIWLRTQYDTIERITGVTTWQLGQWKGLQYHWDVYHPRLGWSNAPGYQSDASVPFKLKINDQGLRADREYAAASAAGTVRVGFFGDSCTFGEEVDDDETVPYHAERWMRPVESLNFGVHGYGLGQMVLRMEEEGFGLGMDHVVIVLLIPLDLARDPLDFFTHAKPRFAVDEDELVIHNVPVPEASRQPWLLRRCFTAAYLFGRPPGGADTVEELGVQLAIAEKLLSRAEAACQAEGVELTLALIANGGTLDAVRQLPAQRQVVGLMRERLSEAGVDTIDLFDELTDLHQRTQGRLVERFGHWKSDANRRIAEKISRHLVAKDDRLTLR